MVKGRERTHLWKLAIALCIWSACCGAASAAETSACVAHDSETKSVVDMAGRNVVLPRHVNRIATVGSVPVLNGFLFALGAGEKIVNSLPPRFTQSNRWRLQTAIAPYLSDRPVLQGQVSSEVSLETLVELSPDVVVTMNLLGVRALETAKIPVVYLEWADASDIRKNMKILGCVVDRMPRSEDYLRYFDATMDRVRLTLEGVANNSPPKALYFNPDSMTTPLLIANWWIKEAGGVSVTAAMASGGNARFSHEQVLAWNPDILIVNTPEQVAVVYQDERFSKINAVRNKKVYATPIGAHSWGQRTIEQPLTVLWAAKLFHPELFEQLDMENEVRTFYRRFFTYELSDEDIRSILTGGEG